MTEPQPDAHPRGERPPRRRTHPLVLMLMGVVPAAAIFWAMYQMQVKKLVQENRNLNDQLVFNMVGRPGEAVPLKLADRFTDADGDLVADPPKDLKEFIDPATINFSYVPTNEPELIRERFKEFVAYLSKETGKPVEYVLFATPEQEVRALHDGQLHVAGINTGNIPTAVNECGFVPFCGLGSGQGVASYQMQIIVPADSPIEKLSDLKGKELTLTEPGSNSGFKAPLVLLSKDHDLQAGRDFALRYSGGHNQSIEGIANKTFRAAAVASDLMKRAMATDPPMIRKEQYRVIYESENFPTAGFGYVWNLHPELAEKVKKAFTSFEWKGTGVEKEFGASDHTKFVPVSFKNDFALVRRIDDAIRAIRESAESSAELPPATDTTAPAARPAATAPASDAPSAPAATP